MSPHVATDANAAIRAQRAASNNAIASRDAAAVVAFMQLDVVVEVAGGVVLRGRDASRAAFAEQFADPAMHGYVRTPEHVSLHASGSGATERGQWVGRWQIKTRIHEQRGHYSAEWKLSPMGWLLASERFFLSE